jgi:hypothetical protein
MDRHEHDRLIGRRPLLGGLGGLAAAAALAPPVSHAAVPSQQQLGSMIQVASRAQLAALDGTVGQAALLTEPGRQGFFVLGEGEAPLADPLQGLTVRSLSGGRHWARMWDGMHGMPEWFGARSSDPTAAANNRTALEACVALCPVTQLAAGNYHVDDTFRIQVSNRTVRGFSQTIEPPYQGGTRILCSNPHKDAILIGGNDADHRAALIRIDEVGAGWSVDLQPGKVEEAPIAFRVQHMLAAYMHRCFALDPLIGYSFADTINSRCVNFGLTRVRRYAGRDFLRGVWVHGTPRHFAGGNASLYLVDGSMYLEMSLRTVLDRPTGIYADTDFADLYVNGFETAHVAYPIILDGAGFGNAAGHGDVHLRNLVLDQIVGDGVTIRNVNELGKIQIDGGYIQLVDTKVRNKGLRFENGLGQITVSNLQITGEDTSSTSIGVYAANRPNLAVSDSVIVENVAVPVSIEKGCPRLSLGCTINAGNLRSQRHAALTLDGASQSLLRPKVTGPAGAWSAGIELLGSGHDRVSIEPTMVDPASVSAGRKVVINGKAVTASGHYSASGDRAAEGTGISVTGIVR